MTKKHKGKAGYVIDMTHYHDSWASYWDWWYRDKPQQQQQNSR